MTGRIDFSLNQSNQFFAQGSWVNSPATSEGLFPYQASAYPLDTEFVALGWNWTLSPTKVNQQNLGVVRDSVFQQGQRLPGIQPHMGITGTSDGDGVPAINLNGYTGFGTSTGLLGDIDNDYQIHESFNWLRGDHQLTMGFSVNYVRSEQSSSNLNARGIFKFNPQYTAQTKSAGGGNVSLVAKTGEPDRGAVVGYRLRSHAKGGLQGKSASVYLRADVDQGNGESPDRRLRGGLRSLSLYERISRLDCVPGYLRNAGRVHVVRVSSAKREADDGGHVCVRQLGRRCAAWLVDAWGGACDRRMGGPSLRVGIRGHCRQRKAKAAGCKDSQSLR